MSEMQLLNRLTEIRDSCFDIETVSQINDLIIERWGKTDG